MKNLALLFIYLAVTMSACHKQKTVHYPLSATLKATFGYNIGTYWIFKDSITNETDSFYVFNSQSYTDIEGNEAVDRMGISIKKFENNSSDSEIWGITLIDSTFSLSFLNSQDYVQTELTINLFTFPYLIEPLLIYGEDSGYTNEIISNITLNGLQFSNTIVSVHKNFSNRIPLIIYNDTYYIAQSAGFVKVIFNHPQTSDYRVLELQRYNIVK